MMKWLVGAGLLMVSFLGVACGGDSDAEPSATPTQEEVVAYCKNVDATQKFLEDMKDALVPFDEVAMTDARANVRASLDYLYSTSDELQGGSDALVTLKEDMEQLNRLFATPDLVAASDDIRAQAAVVENDLSTMKSQAGCP
jgi:hypothetical protein